MAPITPGNVCSPLREPEALLTLGNRVEPGAARGLDAGIGILDGAARFGRKTEFTQREQVDLGVRLALRELVAAFHHLEEACDAAFLEHLFDMIERRGRSDRQAVSQVLELL